MDEDHDPDGPPASNTRQIVAVAILLLVLVGGGLWLTGSLRSAATIQDCVAAGRTNCAPIAQ